MQAIQSYTLPPDKLILAVNYAHARHVLYFSSIALSAFVLLAILYFRVAPRLRKRGGWAVAAGVYLITAIFELPTDVMYHALSLKYGISIEGWPAWLLDWLKSQAVALPLAILLLLGFYFVLRRSPTRWWLYVWIACIPLSIFGVWIEPFVLEPMFNRFEPLAATHPDLIPPIETILARAGVVIPKERLFEMEASAKTNALNAYVSGFGSSKRVVLYDTIIKKELQPALLTTFGHELGHYVLGHIPKSIAFGTVMLFMGLFIAYQAITMFVRRWGPKFDIPSVSDWASLPAFGLLLLLLSFVAEPVVNAYSRNQEHEADVYSLQVTDGIVPDNGQAAAAAFQIEGETDLDPPHPSPFIVFWLYTHPPTSDRLQLALEWRGH
ncbi:MAG TPA: M48 family metallopeptidase [Bryobacteraceae bacterium]|nr:M48 family metallopeptidase [Bryobacteraceae bacterium]